MFISTNTKKLLVGPLIPGPAPPGSYWTDIGGPWVTGLFLHMRPATVMPACRLLTDSSARHEVTGQTTAMPIWYRIRHGESSKAETTTRCCRPFRRSLPSRIRHHQLCRQGYNRNGECLGMASEDFQNLVTDPDGHWSVWKNSATVTDNLSSHSAVGSTPCST